MQVKFFKQGSAIFPRKVDQDSVRESLPASVYMIKASDEGYFLEYMFDRFELPTKVYGRVHNRTERVIEEYLGKSGSCGIILTGPKGTGKTLQSKDICNSLIDKGLPVFIVNAAYTDTEFFTLLENLGDCVVMFDEFGKVYPSVEEGRFNTGSCAQAKLLPVLDGLTQGKRLHILTDNNPEMLSQYILGRPGRATYHFKYGRLEDEVIEEYCKDHKVPSSVIKEIFKQISKIPDMSMDNLIAIVREWSKYKEPIADIVSILNVNSVEEMYRHYVVHKLLDDKGKELKWARGVKLKVRKDRPELKLEVPKEEVEKEKDGRPNYFPHQTHIRVWVDRDNIVEVVGKLITYEDNGHRLTIEEVEA